MDNELFSNFKLLIIRVESNYKLKQFEISSILSNKAEIKLFNMFYYYAKMLYDLIAFLESIMTRDINITDNFKLKFSDIKKEYIDNVLFKHTEYYSEEFILVWVSVIGYVDDYVFKKIKDIYNNNQDLSKFEVCSKLLDLLYLYMIHFGYLAFEINNFKKGTNHLFFDEFMDNIFDVSARNEYLDFRENMYRQIYNSKDCLIMNKTDKKYAELNISR